MLSCTIILFIMHMYTHFLLCYSIFLLESKQCVFCLPLAKIESSTPKWQIQANMRHFQEYNNEFFENDESTLAPSPRELSIFEIGDILFRKGKISASSNSEKNTTEGTTYRRCDRYEGSLKNGMKDGYGIMYYADGSKYIGYWANNTYNSHGVFTLPNGGRYEGSFKNGRRNGNGTSYNGPLMYWGGLVGIPTTDEHGVKCLNYSSYEEPLINYTINVNYTDYNTFFSKYVGEWVDDTPHGQGTMTWSHGGQYEGSFVNGTMDGYGVYYCADGTNCAGQWADDHMNGEGVCNYPTGERFEGTFKNHKRNGNGTYYDTNGTKSVCQWIDDEADGHCMATWTNGDRYEGNVESQRFSGNGTYYYTNGCKYMLIWINGTITDQSVLMCPNTTQYKGPLLGTNLRPMKLSEV